MSFCLSLISFAVASAYLPGISNAANAPRWAIMSVVVPIFLWVLRRPLASSLDYGHALGAALLIWAALSMWWTPSRWDGADALWHWLLLGGVFGLFAQIDDMRPVYIGFGLGVCASSALMAWQWLGAGAPLTGTVHMAYKWGLYHPGGLFGNSSFAGEAAALAIVGALSRTCDDDKTLPVLERFRRLKQDWLWWLLAAGCLPCLVLSGSRGGLFALGVVGLAWLWGRFKPLTVGLGCVGLAVLWDIAGSRTALERFDIWADTAQNLRLFGHGVGSFWVNFPNGATHTDTLAIRYDHAHNDFLEIAYEFGLCGVVLVGAIVAFALRHSLRMDRLVVVAFLAEATVGFPTFTPATAFLGVAVIGHICGGWYGLYGRLDRWGVGALAAVPRARPDLERDLVGVRGRGKHVAAQP